MGEHPPALNLSLEDHKGLTQLPIYDPGWQAHRRGADIGEVLNLVRVAAECEKRIAKGEISDPVADERIPYEAVRLERMRASAACLKKIMLANKLHDTAVQQWHSTTLVL